MRIRENKNSVNKSILIKMNNRGETMTITIAKTIPVTIITTITITVTMI